MRFGTRWSSAIGYTQELIADELAEWERNGETPADLLERLERVVDEQAGARRWEFA